MSVLSDVQIFNQALSHVGSQRQLASFADNGSEAALANLWYGPCRDWCLRSFEWPWATVFAPLAQVSAVGVRANQAWNFSYRTPADCLYVQRLLWTPLPPQPPLTTAAPALVSYERTTARRDDNPYPIQFGVGSDANGGLIYTDKANASVEYTQAITDPTLFPQDFAFMLAWYIAANIAMPLAKSNERRTECMQNFMHEWSNSRARALNEKQRANPYNSLEASESIRARTDIE